ncbi:MAG: TAXI family TRAP transporter solute-binding subunit [Panacagrimonas sp.]
MTDDPPRPRRTLLSRLPKIPKIPKILWRDLAQSVAPVLLIGVVAIALAMHYVRPAPPSTLVITTGPEGSTFHRNAERYKKIIESNGITLEIRTSGGSLENLDRLTDPDSGVDIGFVQGGVKAAGDTVDLVSLGSVFYQPISIFYRSPKPLGLLSELKGKRIVVGAMGSGTGVLALDLLKANGIEPGGPTELLNLKAEGARQALLDREVDAIFLSGDSAAPAIVREMMHSEGIRLYDFKQADGYVRRLRYLKKLQIPAGSFDLGENLPAEPLNMLAPTVELLARPGLHPALSDLLIEAAREVNSRAGMFQAAGEFPAPLQLDYPISDDADRFYKSGKTISYRYLPFWLASLLDRTLVVLVPLIVVLIPALRLVPVLYGWRITNRINHRYGEVMALERAALSPLTPDQKAALIERLGEIERSIIGAKMPEAYADQIYILRRHIKFVRERLA